MENYDQGDLTDVVRSYGGHSSSSQSQPPNSDNPMLFSSAMEESRIWNFGNPLSNIQDPFLHNDELNNIPCSSSFNGRNNSGQVFISSSSGAGFGGASSIILSQKILEDDMLMRRRSMPCNNNIFSNMIQISPKAKLPLSPCSSPAAVVMAPLPGGIYKASDMVSGSVINANSSKDCLVDNTGVQISSRNLGIKGRKSKVKKVVCIPAPATGNSSQSKGGEVAPSDLWAWRKYGQKPIKGSPYPRGYYRCSSSKGCSARKQVERSRADPNMLVITYTSEHNHPWPTQRNALAGSTRNSHTSSSSKNHNSEIISQNPKEEEDRSPVVASNNSVKEEIMEDIEKQQQLENMDEEEFSERNQSEDLFAELGEIGFTGQDFSARNNVLRDFSKALDPFHLFDWSADETTNTNLF